LRLTIPIEASSCGAVECADMPDSQACTDCQTANGCDTLLDDCTGEVVCSM
jgi:hypothetical protein